MSSVRFGLSVYFSAELQQSYLPKCPQTLYKIESRKKPLHLGVDPNHRAVICMGMALAEVCALCAFPVVFSYLLFYGC